MRAGNAGGGGVLRAGNVPAAASMRTDELDFFLPPELIAQTPAGERAASRLLHYREPTARSRTARSRTCPACSAAGDLLVFNDARVIPARFNLRKATGGRIEGCSSETRTGPVAGPAQEARPAAGARLSSIGSRRRDGRAVAFGDGGEYEIEVRRRRTRPGPAGARSARMPLPPYIRRERRTRTRATTPTGSDTRRSTPAHPARSPRRRPGCTSRPNCWPHWTPPASSGRSSRCTSARARSSP